MADLTLSEEDRRELVIWAVSCVERLLAYLEADQPQDPRLRLALRGAGRFVEGGLGVGPVRELAFGCHAAAREASNASATAVATSLRSSRGSRSHGRPQPGGGPLHE